MKYYYYEINNIFKKENKLINPVKFIQIKHFTNVVVSRNQIVIS